MAVAGFVLFQIAKIVQRTGSAVETAGLGVAIVRLTALVGLLCWWAVKHDHERDARIQREHAARMAQRRAELTEPGMRLGNPPLK